MSGTENGHYGITPLTEMTKACKPCPKKQTNDIETCLDYHKEDTKSFLNMIISKILTIRVGLCT